jgi:uncharacterized repeat protein (TIGR01451 family)
MNTISVRKTLSRFIGSCALLALSIAGSAQAATITVTSFLDNAVNCTLRKAILNANAGGVVALGSGTACTAGTPGSNTIVLGTGTYLFDLAPANGLPSGSFAQFDLVNNNITIQGNGPANTIIDGQEKDFIFDNFNGTTNISITLTGLTVTRGKKGPSGFDFGGMYADNASVTLDNVVFTNNTTTASGAAVFIESGTLTINNSTFSANTSSGEGGAIRSTGPMSITNTTFTGNSAVRGGALYFAGNAPGGTENAAITNSTFSGNTATQMGGAISLSGSTGGLGAMTLTHVTIANNTVTGGGGTGGGIYKNQSGAFNIDRSIIANNTAAVGPDCNANGAQSFNSLNYNVVGSTTACNISGTTTDNFVGVVTLNALAGNGGPTQTISLPAYSPARDRAPTCATPTDQRGTARPLGIQCDSGAFEASPTVPQAPPIGAATAGNAQASITFTAPANNGGAPITGYTMTSNPGGITGTGAGSPIVVSGLANGTAYTFTVTAANSVGTSAASAASNSVTPSGPPGAPTIGTATAGNAQASVTFTAPASNGGSAITGYTATSSPGGLTASGAASPLVVTGLTNGTAYTFTVRATNVNGQGPASAASNSVTPATVPGAPAIGTATAGNAQASVTFTAPASNGGSAITSYTVTSSPGGLTGTGATSPIVVSSLTNGTAYTFTVTATNAAGTGAASAASNSVVPIAAVSFADVALTETVDNPTPGLGSNVTFTIVATNLGPSVASGVQVTDLLPAGLTYVSDTPSAGTYSSATGVWNIATIANAGSATLSLVATVSRTQALVNQATKTAQAAVDPDASNNAALVGLNGPPLADIQVQQTVDNATPGIGATVIFTLSAKNAGPSSATGVQLTDLLPASLTFVTASASQGSYVAATGLWTVGAVANGATATLQITATNTLAAPLSNVAVKTAEVESDHATGNDAASVTLNDTTPADLSLSNTASQEPVADGITFAYTIVVANYGPASATGVTVTDTLPAGVALVSATPSQGSCTGTTSVSCSLGTMNVGGTAEIALVVTKTIGGPLSNVATVTANEADPNSANNSHGEVTTPVELIGFQIE